MAALAAAMTLAAPAAAGGFVLEMPLDCALGETCQIRHYTDRDPGPGRQDYRCGRLTYDGHDGTDFGLPTLAAMHAGVYVLAAAPGVVAALRDGMADTAWTPETAARTRGRECGNGVVLRHEDGYETQYCHMQSGSISVSEGESVDTGTPLGRVGLSGRTQFPHLHFEVRHRGQTIDPFDAAMTPDCSGAAGHLWQNRPAYRPGGLLDAGFAPVVPAYDEITAGTAARPALPADAPALVLFGLAHGGLEGDRVELGITGPQGRLLSESMVLDKDQAQFFRAAGKRLTAPGWPSGTYRGTVTLIRSGTEIAQMQASVTIP